MCVITSAIEEQLTFQSAAAHLPTSLGRAGLQLLGLGDYHYFIALDRCLVGLMMRRASCQLLWTMLHRRLIGASVGLRAIHLVVNVRAPYLPQLRR